ncbi:MAG: tRNA preQ1(34) S-adenosylmethionine ribosyltransferase-isomerase QueA [Pseudomonadota bacterium]
MRVEEFDFHLPEARIALAPVRPRDAARLLLVRPGEALEDQRVAALPGLLRPGDALVFNDSRVIPARLFGRRGAAKVEITLHKHVEGKTWRAFARNAKRLKVGDDVRFADDFSAVVTAKGAGGEVTLRLEAEEVMASLARHGVMPLPPYIASRRPVAPQDSRDYQTVYARRDGAVAAPTAGLHFTGRLLAALDEAGIERAMATLHVGAGTFLPVKAEDTADHQMHSEWGELSAPIASRLNAVRAAGGRIIAVGTTALRLLESAAREDGTLRSFAGETDIFITPGYRFRAVDGLFTNFHLPRSTLFMLVSAFCGLEVMRAAYAHAIAAGYRFYSYGDACLLLREAARR